MTTSELDILWRDEHLAVVAKPPRMLVVHAPGRTGATVSDVLSRQLGHRCFPVHRLDEDVTGVLVVALQPASRKQIESVFREHRAERVYLALLSRAPDPVGGRIESRLREGKDGIVRSITSGQGERAVTEYRTLQRGKRYTLVECRLDTGRRNQIRVHMSDLGCPIVGDRKYGFRVRGGGSFPRPLLHAERVSFDHPITGERVEVEALAPESELRRPPA